MTLSLLLCLIEIPVLMQTVDPNQMLVPHYAASDLGLHCLPVSLLWDARDKKVNTSSMVYHLIPVFLLTFQVWSM